LSDFLGDRLNYELIVRSENDDGRVCASLCHQPFTSPAFVANSPEPGQLRTATRSFPAVLAAALPARTTRHEQVSLRPPDDVCWPAVQSSHALLLLDVRKPEMVSGLRN